MIFENFFIKAPITMLNVPLPLVAFEKPVENTDAERYYTIVEYLASYGHSVKRYTNDNTMFLKGFGFSIAGLDEMRTKLTDYGLTENVNFFILSHPQALEELTKPEWVEVIK